MAFLRLRVVAELLLAVASASASAAARLAAAILSASSAAAVAAASLSSSSSSSSITSSIIASACCSMSSSSRWDSLSPFGPSNSYSSTLFGRAKGGGEVGTCCACFCTSTTDTWQFFTWNPLLLDPIMYTGTLPPGVLPYRVSASTNDGLGVRVPGAATCRPAWELRRARLNTGSGSSTSS